MLTLARQMKEKEESKKISERHGKKRIVNIDK